MRVDQFLDFVGVRNSVDRDFDLGLASAGNANLADIKNSVQERLVQLNVTNILVPNFRHILARIPRRNVVRSLVTVNLQALHCSHQQP